VCATNSGRVCGRIAESQREFAVSEARRGRKEKERASSLTLTIRAEAREEGGGRRRRRRRRRRREEAMNYRRRCISSSELPLMPLNSRA